MMKTIAVTSTLQLQYLKQATKFQQNILNIFNMFKRYQRTSKIARNNFDLILIEAKKIVAKIM